MIAGRIFQPGEDATGAPGDLALLSHRFWMRRYAGDRTIVGNTIQLDGRPYQVVGIVPPGQAWLESADVFVPFVRRAKPDRSSWELLGDWPAETRRLDRSRDRRSAARGAGTRSAIPGGQSRDDLDGREFARVGRQRRPARTLWILLGATGLLLLIACVNATNCCWRARPPPPAKRGCARRSARRSRICCGSG
jgi:hypothetical protein